MTWTNRFRLWGGLLATVLVVAALTLVFNQRQTQATSESAEISAATYTVGADWGGTVVNQKVEEGDRVTKGQDLFTVQSLQLKSELEKGLEVTSADTYSINKSKGTITYYAPRDGMITKLDARTGNSIPTGTGLAELTVNSDRYIEAHYHLTPRDYARLEKGAQVRILMPNNQTVWGTVSDIVVKTDEQNQALTTIRVDTPDIESFDKLGLANPGTPVVATVILRDDGPLAGVNDLVIDFLRQIGLK